MHTSFFFSFFFDICIQIVNYLINGIYKLVKIGLFMRDILLTIFHALKISCRFILSNFKHQSNSISSSLCMQCDNEKFYIGTKTVG